MYSVILFISLLSLTSASISFKLNPDCKHELCNSTDTKDIYYGETVVNDRKNHMIFSSFNDFTISIFQTNASSNIQLNYDALFAEDYEKAINVTDGSILNSLSIVIPRLIEFNDVNNDANMNNDLSSTISYYLTDLIYDNVTATDTDKPTFRFELQNVTGNLTIDINYPGSTLRDSNFPKLKVEPSSFFLDIALQASNCTFDSSRFALEFYIISHNRQPFHSVTTSFIDDQYTPGIFNVIQLLGTNNDKTPSSMLWKPVVYQTDERSVEENTLMKVYTIQNNISWDENLRKGIFLSLQPHATIDALNVSFGSADDGFFAKTNYAFVQFTAGLDRLEPDSVASFVTIAAIVSFALPVVVGIIAAVFIIRRKFSKDSPKQDRILNN